MQQNPLKSDFIEDMAMVTLLLEAIVLYNPKECFDSWMICMRLPSSLWGDPTAYRAAPTSVQ